MDKVFQFFRNRSLNPFKFSDKNSSAFQPNVRPPRVLSFSNGSKPGMGLSIILIAGGVALLLKLKQLLINDLPLINISYGLMVAGAIGFYFSVRPFVLKEILKKRMALYVGQPYNWDYRHPITLIRPVERFKWIFGLIGLSIAGPIFWSLHFTFFAGNNVVDGATLIFRGLIIAGDIALLAGSLILIKQIANGLWALPQVIELPGFPVFLGGLSEFVLHNYYFLGNKETLGLSGELACVKEWSYEVQTSKGKRLEQKYFKTFSVPADIAVQDQSVKLRIDLTKAVGLPGSDFRAKDRIFWELKLCKKLGPMNFYSSLLIPVYANK